MNTHRTPRSYRRRAVIATLTAAVLVTPVAFAQSADVIKAAEATARQHNENVARQKHEAIKSSTARAEGGNVIIENVLTTTDDPASPDMRQFSKDLETGGRRGACAANKTNAAFKQGMTFTVRYNVADGRRLTEFKVKESDYRKLK